MALTRSRLSLLVTFSILPYTILAQNAWLYPDPKTNPTYNYIDILNASWTTTFELPNLILWCTANAGGAYGQKYNQSVPPIGNRLLHLNFSETAPQGCHFNIYAKKDPANNNLNSGNFNIQIESSSSTVTWSPTNPTASATSSSTTASAASQTSTPTASTSAPVPPPSTEKSSSGLSPAAKAGIGIGAAAGAIALIAGLLFWLRSRRRGRQSQLASYDESVQKHSGYQASGMAASDTHTVPVETDGRMLDHEWPGNLIAQTRFVGELDGSGTKGQSIGIAR